MPRLLSHPQRTPVAHGQKAKGWAHCENAPHPDFLEFNKAAWEAPNISQLYLPTLFVLQVMMQEKTHCNERKNFTQ